MKKIFLPLFIVALFGLIAITSCKKEENTTNVVPPTPYPVLEDDDYEYMGSGEKIYYDVIDSVFVITVHERNDSLFARAKRKMRHLYSIEITASTNMMVYTSTGEIDSMLAYLKSTGEDFGYCHLLKERGSMDDIRYWPCRQIFVNPKQNVEVAQLLDELEIPYFKEELFLDGPTRLVYLKGEKDLSLYYSNRLFETGKVDFAEPNMGSLGSYYKRNN